MTRQSIPTSRPLIWEEEAPAENRARRTQQGAPAGKRGAQERTGVRPVSGISSEVNNYDEDFPRVGRQARFDDAPPRPWWRPASTAGRVFLGLAALVVIGALTTGVLALRSFLDHDARFRIAGSGNIQASGLAEVSRSEMLPVFGEDIGRNIFFIPLAERRRQLEQIPWVEHATVMRVLPDQIRVAVVERQPIAFVRQGQQIGLVDASGVLLSMPAAMMAQHHYSFPVVTGIDARDPLLGRRARMAVYQRLLSELDSGGQRLSEQISEIDLTDPEDARILMPEPGRDVLAHFGEDHFLERYQRYQAHIAEWRAQYPKLAAVDLRYDQQVVLEMVGGGGSAQIGGAAPAGEKIVDGLSAVKPSPAQPMTADAAAEKPAKPQAGRAQEGKPQEGRAQAAAPARSAAKTHEKKLTPGERMRKRRAEAHRAALLRQKQHAAASQPH